MGKNKINLGFYDSQVNPEQIRTGLLISIIAIGALVVRMILLAVPGIPIINWSRLSEGGIIIGIVGTIVTSRYALYNRKKIAHFGPVESTLLLIAVVIAVGFVNVGLDNSNGIDNYSYFLVLTLVGIIGNNQMRFAVWIFAIASFLASNWYISPVHSGPFWASFIYFSVTLFLINLMIGVIMSTLAGRNKLRISINSMVTHCCNFSSIEEAYNEAVKLLPFAVPSLAVIAFIGNGPNTNKQILGFWSKSKLDPQELLANSELQELVAQSAILTNPKYLVIPSGFTEIGEIFLVILREKSFGYLSRYPDEVAYLIGGGLLRINSEVSNLSRLTKESLTDSLTGLANRRALDIRLTAEVNRSIRSKAPLTIILLDLDNFKLVNDTYGHQVGDEILRSIAAILATRIRGQDLATRYGGEEFMLILPDTNITGAIDLIEELMKSTTSIKQEVGSQPLNVTFSSGIAMLNPDENIDSLIYRSDQALYEAKSRGKNCYVVSDPDLSLGTHK